jgi:hypothetical protein
MRKQAEPKVRDYREISVEADALRRQLQAKLKCSANELAERAIHARCCQRAGTGGVIRHHHHFGQKNARREPGEEIHHDDSSLQYFEASNQA